MSKKNEVAKTESHVPQVAPHLETAPQEVLNSDIIIPKLLLMQGLSEFVANRQKTPDGHPIGQGDLVKSTTADVVGDPESPVDIVPLKMTTSYRLEERVGGKFEYRGTEPRTALNEDLPWEFKKDGAEWKRTKTIDVFALLPSDIEAYQGEMKKFAETGDMPDINKTLMPVVVSFRSTSFNAGKKVSTFFAQLRDMSQKMKATMPPYNYTVELLCKQTKNDKGSFYIFDIGKTKKLASALVEDAARWYGILNAMKEIRVDTAGESDSSPQADLAEQF